MVVQPLQCRLPATVRCLSHPSAHVRALSTSVLRLILHIKSDISSLALHDVKDAHVSSLPYLTLGVMNWLADVEKCLIWEANSRRATGMTLSFLDAAAKELGCIIPS